MTRLSGFALLLAAAAPLAAQQQQPRQLTADDYARAERFLGVNTVPLVIGTVGRPTWIDGSRFWYRTMTPEGSRFVVVDPSRRTREPAFDHPRLAAALASASGGRIDPDRLPFQSFDLSRDSRSMTVAVQGRTWTCDLQQYSCMPGDTTSAAPPASRDVSVSPDGKTVAFIRANDLWARDVATGAETRLTTDGIANFGYATDNAGWTHSDRPIVS